MTTAENMDDDDFLKLFQPPAKNFDTVFNEFELRCAKCLSYNVSLLVIHSDYTTLLKASCEGCGAKETVTVDAW